MADNDCDAIVLGAGAGVPEHRRVMGRLHR